jgi:hypothetical protein
MGEITKVKVVGRKRDADGNPIGVHNTNPILDTREYEVEFPDGATDVFMANMITESMYSQVDSDAHSFVIMSEIIDHKSDGTTVLKGDGFEVTNQGQ